MIWKLRNMLTSNFRVRAQRARPGMTKNYPRPTNGIFDAITVMNSTLASSGRLAM
jgi:hypothetical protein